MTRAYYRQPAGKSRYYLDFSPGEKKSKGSGIDRWSARLMTQKGADMQNGYSSVGEVASRLGVGYWKIKYAHASRHIPEPLRVGNTRLYTEDDIKRLELYFGKKEGGNDQVQLRR